MAHTLQEFIKKIIMEDWYEKNSVLVNSVI